MIVEDRREREEERKSKVSVNNMVSTKNNIYLGLNMLCQTVRLHTLYRIITYSEA